MAGRTVISDRYVDSTLAFQGETPDEAEKLYELFKPEILIPDITFILKCPVDIGLKRIARDRGSVTKFEDIETLEKARVIYESRTGSNYVFLDASGSVANTFNQMLETVTDILKDLTDEFLQRVDEAALRDWGVRLETDNAVTPRVAVGS
jgi:thymidylate kinase